MLNQVILMGRLTADPELRATQSGKTVCTFTLAVDRGGRDEGVYFLDCVAWEKTAGFLSRNFSKGKLAAVCGRLTARTYTDKEGKPRKVTEVIADQVHFCGDYGERGGSQIPPSPKGGYTGTGGISPEDGFAGMADEGNLPF